MPIVNLTRGTLLAGQVSLADTFVARAVGLLNRASLCEGDALIITRCNSIHMFFMKFPIDAVFVAKDNRVTGLAEGLKPFRLSPVFWQADFVIELPAGAIKASQTKIGDQLKIDGFKSGD